MVQFALKLTAELFNVTNLEPIDDPENAFEYTFRIQCTSCREIHGKPVTINRFESHEITGSRGEASFVFRCKQCKSEHSASITRTGDSLTPENSNKPVTILTIDSRGLDVLEFIPEGEFRCVGEESGTIFKEVELSEGEWYDYDNEAGDEVSVTEVKWIVERI